MQDNNKSVTFVYGGDDFLVDRRSRVLFGEIGGNNCEIFRADEPNRILEDLKNIVTSLLTGSLFADGNAMWIRGACFLGEKTLSENEKSAVSALLDALKSNHGKHVIISSASVDKRTKIFKDLLQFTKNIDLDATWEDNSVEAMIVEFANDNGVKIDRAAVQLLHAKCGKNARLLEQEISKLSTYAIDRRSSIGENDVAEMVDFCCYGDFFEPVEKFFSDDIGSVFQSLDKYFFHDGDARPLLSAFQSRNRLLIQLRTLIDMKRIRISNDCISKNDILHAAESFHMNYPTKSTFNVFSQNVWFVSKLVPACTRFSLNKLLRFQAAFSHAFAEIIERYNEQKTVLKELAVECLVTPGLSTDAIPGPRRSNFTFSCKRP
jgi:DNA polymerase-3 subunit delta